jgi:hypothetical protein
MHMKSSERKIDLDPVSKFHCENVPANLREALKRGFNLGGGVWDESRDKLTCRGRFLLVRERKGENASEEHLVIPFIAKYKFGRPRRERAEDRGL